MQSNSKKIKFENTYFYTRMYDAIATSPFQYEGKVILYDGTLVTFFQIKIRKSFITGLSTKFSAMVFKIRSMLILIIIWVELLKRCPQAPLDHIAPFWEIGILYANSRANIEAYLLYNGKKKRRLFFKW
jgi:hemoglobin/transferrin/lactoferrin receptor protein